MQQNRNYYDLVCDTILNSNLQRNFLFVESENFNNKSQVLTTKEFEILGGLAYLHGLSFTTQRGELNKEAMLNFNARMEVVKLSKEELESFVSLIDGLTEQTLIDANVRQEALLLKPTKIDTRKFLHILDGILQCSAYDVEISEELHRFTNLEELDYSDLLKIHKTIFEKLDINGGILLEFSKLMELPNVKEEYEKAIHYFDLQKYSLISYDAIMSLKEWFDAEPELMKIYASTSDVSNLRSNSEIDAEFLANNVKPNVPQESKFGREEINPALTDEFLRATLMESGRGQELLNLATPQDVIQAFENLLENEELLPTIFQFLRARVSVGRQDLTEVYGFDCTPIVDEYKKRYLEIKTKMRADLEKYHQDIDSAVLKTINEILNSVIETLVVSGVETKGYMLQQLTESQIKTYKHLHQFLALVEKSKLVGIGFERYVELVNFIRENIEVKSIFAIAENFDTDQMHMNYSKGILDFYLGKDADNLQ